MHSLAKQLSHTLEQVVLLHTFERLLQLHQARVYCDDQPVEAHKLLAEHRVHALIVVNRVPEVAHRFCVSREVQRLFEHSPLFTQPGQP